MLHAVKGLVAVLACLIVCAGCIVPKADYDELARKYQELEKEKNDVLLKLKAANLRAQDLAARLKEKPAPEPVAAPRPIDDPDFPVNTDTNCIMLDDSILFASGSVALKKSSARVLQKLAGILNSSEYSAFRVRVDGYTDDQPVVKTRKLHKDNWLLSAKRAHAVMEKLVSLGVSRERFEIRGMGPLNPVAPNRPGNKGNSRNRRVEIGLLK